MANQFELLERACLFELLGLRCKVLKLQSVACMYNTILYQVYTTTTVVWYSIFPKLLSVACTTVCAILRWHDTCILFYIYYYSIV